jgi:hypothetical protein
MLIIQTEVLMMEQGKVNFYSHMENYPLSTPYKFLYYPLGTNDDPSNKSRSIHLEIDLDPVDTQHSPDGEL